MPLALRLIEQARHLTMRDSSGRPRQDHLRRAVSTAYYGLFHFLIDQAVDPLWGPHMIDAKPVG